jgi:L-lactate utilization protein LutC
MSSGAEKKSDAVVAKKPTRPKQLSRSEVREIVLKALGDEGAYCEMQTLHSKFDHPERKIDFNDVLFGLNREWDEFKVDEFSEENWQWKYEIRTRDVEDREFSVVIALDPRHYRFTVVTRWPDD